MGEFGGLLHMVMSKSTTLVPQAQKVPQKYQNSLKLQYLPYRCAELGEIWHVEVFRGAFQQGDVTFGVGGRHFR